jgi:hypothetical protein
MRRQPDTWVMGMAVLLLTVMLGGLQVAQGKAGLTDQKMEPTGHPGSLTLAQLKNATYMVMDKKITLRNGSYNGGTLAKGNFLDVRFYRAIFGDLNHDGNYDAAVIYSYNSGGSGSFVTLGAMLNQGGNPQQAALELGDRVVVNSMAIREGVIILDMLVHGPDDPLANPTKRQTQKYMLAGNRLVPAK